MDSTLKRIYSALSIPAEISLATPLATSADKKRGTNHRNQVLSGNFKHPFIVTPTLKTPYQHAFPARNKAHRLPGIQNATTCKYRFNTNLKGH